MALLVSERDCQPDPKLKMAFFNSSASWPRSLSWTEAEALECIPQYQTTPIRFAPHRIQTDGRMVLDIFQFMIGSETCEELDKKTVFCNGPLKPETKYAVVLRLFTDTGFSDSEIITFATFSVVYVWIIISGVVSSMLLAFVLGLLIVRRKRQRAREAEMSEKAPKDQQPAVGSILIKNFVDYFDDLAKNNCERLENEFKLLNNAPIGKHVTFAAAKQNETKNRYTNIFPCEYTYFKYKIKKI